MAPRLKAEAYIEGIRQGDRVMLARAITLVESIRPDDQKLAQSVLNALLSQTGQSLRIGLSGPPGVGKSTTMDALGMQLITAGHQVAVLAIDPSSQVGGGSILGDKTRMPRLGASEHAFIRPSPAGKSLGGVAEKTREALLLCEAAGYDVVIVETVGVGQSEIMVSQLVDTFVALMLPNAGDELQGIKKGIIEVADIIAINKADGPMAAIASRAKREHENALHYSRQRLEGWSVPVVLMSALEQVGLQDLWATVQRHHQFMRDNGHFHRRRSEQRTQWMWNHIQNQLLVHFHQHPQVQDQLEAVELLVRDGALSPVTAAKRLLKLQSIQD
ncbi:MAG: methylmalonyl Co-A mutase-associated GTPase MeaB [Myxococcota bacterium]|nr:methylmalonyl Co-A mutase-associated GTPase MeaB [Myxococcota bacterium]